MDNNNKSSSSSLPEAVKDFFYWKNPLETGAAFAFMHFYVYLIYFSGYSLLSLTAFLLLVNLIVTMLVTSVRATLLKFNIGPSLPQLPGPFQLDTQVVTNLVEGLIGEMNCCLRTYSMWQSCQNVPASLAGLLGLFVAAHILQLFSVIGFFYFVGIIAFIGPIGYSRNKVLVDANIEKVRHQLSELYRNIYAKLPENVRKMASTAASSSKTD